MNRAELLSVWEDLTRELHGEDALNIACGAAWDEGSGYRDESDERDYDRRARRATLNDLLRRWAEAEDSSDP